MLLSVFKYCTFCAESIYGNAISKLTPSVLCTPLPPMQNKTLTLQYEQEQQKRNAVQSDLKSFQLQINQLRTAGSQSTKDITDMRDAKKSVEEELRKTKEYVQLSRTGGRFVVVLKPNANVFSVNYLCNVTVCQFQGIECDEPTDEGIAGPA